MKILARLTAATPWIDQPRGGSGLGLSAADVAGACQDLTEPQFLIVMAKWVLDKSAQNMLFYALYRQVVDLAVERRWDIPRGKEYLRTMTRMAIWEVVNEARCTNCHGTKITGDAQPCRVCRATGYFSISGEEKAAILEMSSTRWSRVWGHRYGQIYNLVAAQDAEALYKIRLNLRT